MGEENVPLFKPEFNRSVRVISSETPLTEDTGCLLVREASAVLGLDQLLETLPDCRDPDHITYTLPEVVRARVLLLAQGWEDQGDATNLRFDPALRLAVSDHAGETPLAEDSHLPSQPTLSRMQHALASEKGTATLESILRTVSLKRILQAEPTRRMLTIDIDTLPKEAHGHQDGSSYNTHYGFTCFQPLVAFAETGDLLAAHLRPGGNPTARESFEFLAPVIDDAKKSGLRLCVRMDAGFSNALIMRELDDRKVRFVTRLKNTDTFHRLTQDWYERMHASWRECPSPNGQPRTATYELWERPHKAGRVRRIIAVTVEAGDGELFPKRFYLCTNFPRREGGSNDILAHYRQRGTAEVYIGDLVGTTVPSMRAVPRGKTAGTVTICDNNVSLLLGGLAYELIHHLRRGVEIATGVGWSLKRLRERVLKIATQVVRHARHVVFKISKTKVALWAALKELVSPSAQLRAEVTR